MHRARSLTINTSNACLVNKFNTLNSSNSKNGSGGRPYTPLPPSCRLHRIYEEKLEVLGAIGHENWFDDHANPFYRHAEPQLTRQGSSLRSDISVDHSSDDELYKNHASKPIDIVIKTTPPTAATAGSMARYQTPPRFTGNDTLSTEFTGFESLDSDSESDELIDNFWDGEEADEIRSLFTKGYRDSNTPPRKDHSKTTTMTTMKDKNQENEQIGSPKTEMEYRRLSNRNRIMDRGRLMPDTAAIYLPLPWQNQKGCAPLGGGAKIRALSPYPRPMYEY
ncbi:hypothetical protein BGX27_004665 [Mortierella sp. AM989]|nr:hypothetical protein BGX27_004665 [Mortierella sp. AM989]